MSRSWAERLVAIAVAIFAVAVALSFAVHVIESVWPVLIVVIVLIALGALGAGAAALYRARYRGW